MTQIALLLQIAIIMLTGVANNQNATQAQRDQAFAFANQAVSMAMKYIQNPDTTVATTTIATVPQIVPQTTVTPTTPVTPAQVFGATPAPVSKTVRIKSGGCNANMHGLYCSVEVKYLENNVEKNGVSATLSSDDQGSFTAVVPDENPAYGETTTSSRATVTGYIRSRDNIAHFGYRPFEKGQRTLTATVNGATTTLEFPGQLLNCVGIIDDPTQEGYCNK